MMMTLTKDTAWQEMLELTHASNKGWEFDERVLKRLDELRPYYWQVRKRGSGRKNGEKRSIAVRLTDKDGNSTIYPSKVSASQAIGMRYNGIAQETRKPDFNGYVKGYKVEVLDGDVQCD